MDESRYVKASDYDIKAQRHNHSVFRKRMQKRPWIPFMIGTVSAGAGALLLFSPSIKSCWERPVQPMILGGLVLLLGCYFFSISATRDRQQQADNNSQEDV